MECREGDYGGGLVRSAVEDYVRFGGGDGRWGGVLLNGRVEEGFWYCWWGGGVYGIR